MTLVKTERHAALRAVDITTDVSQPEWDGFVSAHPAATVYHQWGWRTVFERAFGRETVYLAAREQGSIVGILPLVVFRSALFGRFAVSLPFVDYGGICARDPYVAGRLLAHARALSTARRLSYVELRHTSRQLSDVPVREHKVAMMLRLERHHEAAWNALDRKVRNQVRKAEKSHLALRTGGVELVEQFYPVFARNMRDLGTPVYPRQMFEQVLSAFPGSAQMFVVEYEGATIAGALCLEFRDRVVVPLASSLREHRGLCPNNLLYWRMIQFAIARGLSWFDFGRSTPGQGTYQFKEQWGALPEPLYWEYAQHAKSALPDRSHTNPRFHGAIEMWKRLPLGLTTWLGPQIVRSIP
jgi:FemAB-related protein (PEP-CTERM system-associated)